MMRILVTGSTGFIGKILVSHLLEETDAILQLPVRNSSALDMFEKVNNSRVNITKIGNISADMCWYNDLHDCQVVIHTAGRAHIMHERVDDQLRAFRQINAEGTLTLARQAAEAGVQRFIYLSSIKVHGEYTQLDMPLRPDDSVMPADPYAISKYEAEQGLLYLAENSKMEIVIIRPPLVYGPGVKGNFLRILHILKRTVPLPFGLLNQNKRSLISVYNLVDFIGRCITHPLAANQIFLVSDDNDLSTTELFLKIRHLLQSKAFFLPIPSWVLNVAAALVGKQSKMMRICGSLHLDISKSRELLHWKPIQSMDEALRITVQEYIRLYHSENSNKE